MIKKTGHLPLGALLIVGSMLPSHAFSQSVNDDLESSPIRNVVEKDRAATQADRSKRIVSASGPSDQDGFSPNGISFNVLADADKTNASLTLSSGSSHQISRRENIATFATDKFTLKGSVPLAKSDDTTVFDFDGLQNGSSISVGWLRFTHSVSTDIKAFNSTRKEILRPAWEKCVLNQSNKWLASLTLDQQASGQQKRAQYIADYSLTLRQLQTDSPAANGRSAIFKISQASPSAYPELAAAIKEDCVDLHDGNQSKFLNSFGPEDAIDRLYKLVDIRRPVTFYGVEGTLQHKKYKFLKGPNFDSASTENSSFKGAVFGGVISSNGRSSGRASFSYVRGFEEQSEIEVCIPIDGGPNLKCLTGHNGAPKKREKAIVSLEVRKLITLGENGPDIGLAPEVSYDVKGNNAFFELPIYFAPDKKSQLSGGIRFGYGTEKKDFGVGLFVGVPFSIF